MGRVWAGSLGVGGHWARARVLDPGLLFIWEELTLDSRGLPGISGPRGQTLLWAKGLAPRAETLELRVWGTGLPCPSSHHPCCFSALREGENRWPSARTWASSEADIEGGPGCPPQSLFKTPAPVTLINNKMAGFVGVRGAETAVVEEKAGDLARVTPPIRSSNPES